MAQMECRGLVWASLGLGPGEALVSNDWENGISGGQSCNPG